MAWVSLTLDVPETASEAAQVLLYDFEPSGLEVRDHANPVMPQVRPPSPGEAIVIGYFPEREQALAAQSAVQAAIPGVRALLEEVVERDWSVEWRNQVKSVTVGRLWVGPPWESATAPQDKVRLFIEPKMAFGTGDHPTTSLCLAAVDAYLLTHPGATVLDVGTGTGVLALAAKKLGASRCVGVDHDPVAVELARECAQENGLSGVELSTQPLTALWGQFELVLANILANTLIELAPLIAARVNDRLVLAGVLVPQADEVREAYLQEGLTSAGDTVQGEWIRLDLVRSR